MGLFTWLCRCVPGLSLLLWIFVCYEALCGRYPWHFLSTASAASSEQMTAWEIVYIIYSVAAHLSGCIFFPIRLCWSVWHMTDEVRLAKFEAAEMTRPYTESEATTSTVDDKAGLLAAAAGGPNPAGSENGALSRVGTPRGTKFEEVAESITHAIILPSYKEDMDTMRETLNVLASHAMAKSSYDVYLAMEQRDPGAISTADALIASYGSRFKRITYTLHPGDISGEVAGKSSNVSWAARQLSHNYTDIESRQNCVITVMDSDTHLSSNYFLLLTKSHREDPLAASTLYAVPIIFDRNAQQVNPLVRAADIFWCGAGLSGLYKGSSIKIPTSVYSLAMTLAGDVGGWDTGPESIGEDMHMYLKCYFKSKGGTQVKIIYSPASQSNVYSDVKGFRGVFANIYSRYSQALRHMWGSLDSGYAIQKGIESLFRRNDEKLSDWLSDGSPEDRVPRWVNDSNLTHFTPPNIYESSAMRPLANRRSFHPLKLALLYHRLYEAHFLPAHLTVAFVSAIIFSSNVAPSATHPWLLWSFSFCGTLRLLGFLGTGVFLWIYEGYHRVCVRNREDEMKRAGLWEDMQDGFAYRSWRQNWSDYVALPINGTLYGTLPAVVAVISHFWTDRLVYTVSAKPQLKKMAERVLQMA